MAQLHKAEAIRVACEQQDVDALVQLAISPGGLLDDKSRQTAWPILLDCSKARIKSTNAWQNLPRHRDEDQVRLDVHRAFVYYPSNEPEKQMEKRRTELSDLIVSTLRCHPRLNYFQGYHDIVQVFLLVLGPSEASIPVARLSLLRIRDFMLPTLSATTAHLDLLPAILRVADPEVERHLSQTQPFFALSATLTLYAHDIEAYGDIARLFDFLLASDAVTSIYLFAIIIISRKEQLLDIDADEPEMLHSVLSKLPKPLDLEQIISSTVTLHAQHPPEKLPNSAWHRISRYSVLKTTRNRNLLAHQTLEDGEVLLAKQEQLLQRLAQFEKVKKSLSRIRRPVAMTVVAVLVVVLSYWLRKESVPGLVVNLWHHLSLLWPL